MSISYLLLARLWQVQLCSSPCQLVLLLPQCAACIHSTVAGEQKTRSCGVGVADTLLAEGVVAAAQTLTVADFALLGSASLLTGACAALSRPGMVESMSDLIATLQTLWLLFPEMRRSTDSVSEQVRTHLLLASVQPECSCEEGQ
jgi:hypothetical protein